MTSNDWPEWVEELFDKAYSDSVILDHEWEFIDDDEEEQEISSANSTSAEESAADELYADID